MKQVAGRIKLELAQYREMAAFAQFSSDLDDRRSNCWPAAAADRTVKQPQFKPVPIEEQVVAIFAGVAAPKVGVGRVGAFESRCCRK